jgi:hypothetical protein
VDHRADGNDPGRRAVLDPIEQQVRREVIEREGDFEAVHRDVAGGADQAGVVEQDVQRTAGGEELVRNETCLLHRGEFRDDRLDVRVRAVLANVLDGGFGSLAVAADHDHGCAEVGESERGLLADTRAAAGPMHTRPFMVFSTMLASAVIWSLESFAQAGGE